MQISGETIIFRNEHDGKDGKWYTYATGVSSKRQDGSYINDYIDVRFRKGVVVEHKSKINIKNGFLTVREFTVNGETKKKLELMVLDFDTEEFVPEKQGFTALADSDIPF